MEIRLTQDQVAIVDPSCFEWLSQWKWTAALSNNGKTFYAQRYITVDGRQVRVHMHRLIMAAPVGILVDHEDGDGLNNVVGNLRWATQHQNQHNVGRRRDNTSGFKGVHWSENKQRWVAQLRVDGRPKHLGYFLNPVSAAEAYDSAALDYHGEFAQLNGVRNG